MVLLGIDFVACCQRCMAAIAQRWRLQRSLKHLQKYQKTLDNINYLGLQAFVSPGSTKGVWDTLLVDCCMIGVCRSEWD